MAEQRVIRPYVIALVIALVGWLTVPGGMSRLWALTQDQPPIVHQTRLHPLPMGTTVDALVVDTILVFNYPGNDIMDRFGRIS